MKCADEVESCRQRRGHIEVFQVAQDLGLEDEDLFILHTLQGCFSFGGVPPGRWQLAYQVESQARDARAPARVAIEQL